MATRKLISFWRNLNMDNHTQDIRIAQWSSIIQQCNTSGITKKQWCQDNNVNEKQFYYWQRRIRKMIIQTVPDKAEATGVKFAQLPVIQEKPAELSAQTHITTHSTAQLRLNKGNISVEISNLSRKDLLDFTKELLADA